VILPAVRHPACGTHDQTSNHETKNKARKTT
jgi:hypothetical protein